MAQAPRAEICSGPCRLGASCRLVVSSRSVRSHRIIFHAFMSKKSRNRLRERISMALLPEDIYVLTDYLGHNVKCETIARNRFHFWKQVRVW